MIGKYFALMGVNTILTFARGIGLAALLSVAEFGTYATFMAIGMFASVFLGIGQIEATTKSFPRAAADGDKNYLLNTANALNRKILARAVVIAAVLSPIYFWYSQDIYFTALLTLSLAVSIPTASISIYASVARALPDLILLSKSSLLRSVLALALCLTGAIFFGAPGALVGEIAAAAFSNYYVNAKLQAFRTVEESQTEKNLESIAPNGDGLWLLAAALLGSAIMYLDRSFVAYNLGVEEAGRYGLLMIFVTGASALYGLTAQKVGPDLIKAQHLGAKTGELLKILQPWFLTMSCVLITAVLGLFAMQYLPYFSDFFVRFKIGSVEIIMVGILGILQITVLIDWILISLNREKFVFAACLAHALLLSVALLVGWFGDISTQGVFIALIAGRCFQIVVQYVLLLHINRNF